jgi:hypothetical protein
LPELPQNLSEDDVDQSDVVPGELNEPMWQPIPSAPYDRELELAVIDDDGPHALVFPCRRVDGGWAKAGSGEWVEVHPTHWREWQLDPFG